MKDSKSTFRMTLLAAMLNVDKFMFGRGRSALRRPIAMLGEGPSGKKKPRNHLSNGGYMAVKRMPLTLEETATLESFAPGRMKRAYVKTLKRKYGTI